MIPALLALVDVAAGLSLMAAIAIGFAWRLSRGLRRQLQADRLERANVARFDRRRIHV